MSDKKGVKKWKKVEVNLENHINIPKHPEGLSIEEYDDCFDKYLTKIAMDPLPQDRPLWEIHITKYPTSKAAGNLIFKLHHALGDGFSLMGALLSCLERADNPSLPLTFPSFQPSSTAKTTAMGLIGCITRKLSPIYNTTRDFGWSVLKSSLIADDKTPIRSGEDAVELRPIKISTVALSLDQIAKIKTTLEAVSFLFLELHMPSLLLVSYATYTFLSFPVVTTSCHLGFITNFVFRLNSWLDFDPDSTSSINITQNRNYCPIF